MERIFFACLVSTVLTLAVSPSHGATGTLFVSGTQAPGQPQGVIVNSFLQGPQYNDSDQYVITAYLSGPGVTSTTDGCFLFGDEGDSQLAAREGEPAPGTPLGVVFLEFVFPNLGQSNLLGFDARLVGPGVDGQNDHGVWFGPAGSPSLVIRENDQAIGAPDGIRYLNVSLSTMARNGSMAIFGGWRGPGIDNNNNQALYRLHNGNLALVAHEGDQAPGTLPEVLYRDGPVGALIDTTGRVAFTSVLVGNGVNGSNNSAIWYGMPGALTIVHRKGNQAPGLPGGVLLSAGNHFAINYAGMVAVGSELVGAGVDTTNDRAKFVGFAGGLSPVVREGDPAPGTEAETVFGQISFYLALNASGAVAFQSTVRGPGVGPTNSSGIWVGGTGSLFLVVRAGDPAPGAPSGVVFSAFTDPALNEEVGTFVASLAGPGVTSANDLMLFLRSPSGEVFGVAREGASQTDDPWFPKSVQSIIYPWSFTGAEDGRQVSLNSVGLLAFRLNFTDGTSGLYLTDGQATSAIADAHSVSSGHATLRIPSNPVRASAELQVELRFPSRVRIAIYDVKGRCLRTVFDGLGIRGLQSYLWDGRTETGWHAPAGTYFAVLSTGDWRTSSKITVVK